MGDVRVTRTPSGFVATNDRGAQVALGHGDGEFGAVELLQVAVGACNAMTVEPLTTQRGLRLPELSVTISAERSAPTLLGKVTVSYEIELPEGMPMAKFHEIAQRVHDRHCIVSRSLEAGTEVKLDLPDS